MAYSKMRQTEAMGDSRAFQRLWASTRTRHARIAHTDRLDMHVPARREKYWQSESKEFQQQADANSSCPPQNEVAPRIPQSIVTCSVLYTARRREPAGAAFKYNLCLLRLCRVRTTGLTRCITGSARLAFL